MESPAKNPARVPEFSLRHDPAGVRSAPTVPPVSLEGARQMYIPETTETRYATVNGVVQSLKFVAGQPVDLVTAAQFGFVPEEAIETPVPDAYVTVSTVTISPEDLERHGLVADPERYRAALESGEFGGLLAVFSRPGGEPDTEDADAVIPAGDLSQLLDFDWRVSTYPAGSREGVTVAASAGAGSGQAVTVVNPGSEFRETEPGDGNGNAADTTDHRSQGGAPEAAALPGAPQNAAAGGAPQNAAAKPPKAPKAEKPKDE